MSGSGYRALLINVDDKPMNIGYRFIDNNQTRVKVYTENPYLDEYCKVNTINLNDCSVQDFLEMLEDLTYSGE